MGFRAFNRILNIWYDKKNTWLVAYSYNQGDFVSLFHNTVLLGALFFIPVVTDFSSSKKERTFIVFSHCASSGSRLLKTATDSSSFINVFVATINHKMAANQSLSELLKIGEIWLFCPFRFRSDIRHRFPRGT